MDGNQCGFRYEARGYVIPAGSVKRRRVFTWRNLVRSAPRIADRSECPLHVLRPRLYSHASIGSRIWTTLRFDLRNINNKTVHSYIWRHASPVREANGGYVCQPAGGLSPSAHHRESAHLPWRGPITVTIDFVQFGDGEVWLSSDPHASVTRAGLQAGSQRAADHLMRVWREGGLASLGDALRCIHRDVQETAEPLAERGESPGAWGFYAGVTRAVVVASSLPADEVEAALLKLQSTSA
jgi:hypothetical protein